MNGLAAMNLDETRYQLERTEFGPAALPQVETLLRAVGNYQNSVADLDAELRAISGDRDLSEEGRQARRERASQAWADRTERTLADLEARAARMVGDAEARIVPPVTDRDTLADAERHVLLMLEQTPLSQVPRVLSELASSDEYPDVQRLLALTKWGGMLLRSKGATADAERWERERQMLMRPFLSESGQRALDDLAGLRDAATIPRNLRALYEGTLYRYGVRNR